MAGIEKDYLQERRGTARREEDKQGTEAVQTLFTWWKKGLEVIREKTGKEAWVEGWE